MTTENQLKNDLLFKMAQAIAANALVEDGFVKSDEDKRKISVELDALDQDAEKADALVKVLFPTGLPSFDALYEKLSEVSHWLHFGDLAAQATGLVWSVIFRSLPVAARLKFLDAFPAFDGHRFFGVLDGLPGLLSHNLIPADYTCSWLLAIHEHVGNDLASDGLWKGLEAYAEKAPDEALKVLENYLGAQVHDGKLSIAASFLGVLRTLPAERHDAQTFSRIEARYSKHRDVRVRLWSYRSWIYTANRGALTPVELDELMKVMGEGTTEELDERFNIVCRCLNSPNLDTSCVTFLVAWLREHARSDLSPSAKMPIAQLFYCRRDRLPADTLGELILAIQPIAADLLGIWKPVEYFLVDQLKENYGAFEKLFKLIAEKNATGLLALMEKHDGLDYLVAELKQRDFTKLITELILSNSEPVRRLGLFLFDELELKALSPEYLATLTDTQLQVALMETERVAFDGEAIGRFLNVLVPCVEQRGQDVKDAFREELVTQCKNYPGGCLEQLKKIADKSQMVRQAIDEADRYFAALRKTVSSPVNSMAVEGFERGYVMMQRMVSATISEGMKKYSPLLSMIKTVYLVYGMGTAHYQQGRVGDSNPLHKFETNFEVARLEEIDPETMALRRLTASGKLAMLNEAETGSPKVNET